MKKLLLLSSIIFFITSCNKREIITGIQFKEIAEQQGFSVEHITGEKDAELGISAKYIATDSIAQVIFFEFSGETEAKNAFNTFRAQTQKNLTTPIEHGSPNDSGAFGNTQEYFALTMKGENVNLIRITSTLVYSFTQTNSSREKAEKLLGAIGYKNIDKD